VSEQTVKAFPTQCICKGLFGSVILSKRLSDYTVLTKTHD